MYKCILVVSVAIVVIAQVASAGKMEARMSSAPPMNITCKGSPLNMKDFFVSRKECHDELFPTTGSTTTTNPTNSNSTDARKEMLKKWKDNAECLQVCIMKKQKILNTDGTYNADQADKIVKAIFPETVQASMKKAFDDCASANSKSFSMDNKCAGYKAFKDCKVKKFMEICDIKATDHSSENI